MSRSYRMVKSGWLYQPPANPFASEIRLIRKAKKSCYQLQQNISSSMPPFPAPPPISIRFSPPFPVAGQQRRG